MCVLPVVCTALDIGDPSLASDSSTILPPDVLARASHAWAIGTTCVVLGCLAVVYLQPAWVMDFVVRQSHPSVLWCTRTTSQICSLTIDDAPSATTPLLLDLLREHNVKATFFIISSRIPGHEETVRRIVKEGHVLGNHLTEDRASILDELHVFEQKLKECDSAISAFQSRDSHDATQASASAAAVTPMDDKDESTETTGLLSSVAPSYGAMRHKWLRPGSGWFTSNMREIVASHGYRICMGSVYPHDAQIKIESINAAYLRWRTRPGSVIIVHDRPL
ncbi:hypothetical protein ATCC90586_001845 [Pythium insidiosum]|nr:hypothetical protein ATCC90586_001845 [Pythium insidiosum]